jgi:hypothetical protein
MKRLTATLQVQQVEAAKLDAAIAANLREFRYGGHERAAGVEGVLRIGDRMNTPLQENLHYLEFSPPAMAKLFPGRIMPQAAAQIRSASKVQPLVAQLEQRVTRRLIWNAHSQTCRLLAEYSFAGIDKPIGISTYELTRALPRALRSALPTVEEIEAELSGKPQRGLRRKKS